MVKDRVRRTIFSKRKAIVPPQSRAMIAITGANGDLDLPYRDFTSEPSNTLVTLFASVVDRDTTSIVAQNSIDQPITLPSHTKLGVIGDDEVDGYFATTSDDEPLASKGRKGSATRTMLKGLLAAAAASYITQVGQHHASPTLLAPMNSTVPTSLCLAPTAPAVPRLDRSEETHESHLPSGIIVYGDSHTVSSINRIVDDFKPL